MRGQTNGVPHHVHLALVAVLAFGLGGARCAGAVQPEVRAFWADGFNEGFKTPEQVDTLLRRLNEANCNAIFAQMRKRGDAYYLSRYEPWAADDQGHFDALAYLIRKAHSMSPPIQVHAWLNTFAIGNWPANPHHIGTLHPDWRSISDAGAVHDGEATKDDPGHPDAADWTFRVYLDVLRRYEVDGVHLDFVRYGGVEWGYSPASVARFNARHGRTGQPATHDPRWMQWRRDQVTAFVRKVYAMAAAVRTDAAVSAATITWGEGPTSVAEWNTKTAAMTRVFQDWRSWMREGIVDLNCLMSYYREERHAAWYRKWLDWAKDNQYGRFAALASGVWLNPIKDSIVQVAAIRKPSARGRRAHGVMFYSYGGTNAPAARSPGEYNEAFYAALSHPSSHAAAPPFPSPAPFPSFPWKLRPRRGHVKGFVLDATSLLPADGARVTLSGGGVRRRVAADGTGFYAFIDVPPGRYAVQVAASGYSPRRAEVRVAAGRVATANVFVGSPGVPETPDLGRVMAARDGAPVRLRSAMVVGGTDTFPGQVLVASGSAPPVRVMLARPPLVPVQPGDVLAVNGVVGTHDAERVIIHATARLVDMRMPPSEVVPVGGAGFATAAGRTGVVRVSGRVAENAGGRVRLETAAGQAEVLLDGRKDPGVEAPVAALAAPEAGAWVEVVGVCTVTPLQGSQPIVRLRPRTSDDLRALPTPVADVLRRAAPWGLPALFGGGRGVVAPPRQAQAPRDPSRDAQLTGRDLTACRYSPG